MHKEKMRAEPAWTEMRGFEIRLHSPWASRQSPFLNGCFGEVQSITQALMRGVGGYAGRRFEVCSVLSEHFIVFQVRGFPEC